MSDEAGTTEALATLIKRAFAAADRAALDRAERLELAEMLLKRDVESWTSLGPPDWARIVDALDGWHLVDTLHRQRSPHAAVEAGVVEREQPALRE